MRTIDFINLTTDSRSYRHLRYRYLLGCSHCRPHRRDNARHHGSDNRSWKNYRRYRYHYR